MRKGAAARCRRAADFACQGKADRGFLRHIVPKGRGNLCMRLRRHHVCDATVGHFPVWVRIRSPTRSGRRPPGNWGTACSRRCTHKDSAALDSICIEMHCG